MKLIRAIVNVEVQFMLGEELSVGLLRDLEEKLRGEALENRLKVLACALCVERELDSIILHYFLGESHDRSEDFDSLILRSDWCTFASKRKLVTHIVNEQNLLQGSEKNAFEKLMKEVMSFRNAFTHGKMHGDAEGRVFLSYFEGKPQEVELTDDYLTRVERTLHEAHDIAQKLFAKLEATKVSDNGDGAA